MREWIRKLANKHERRAHELAEEQKAHEERLRLFRVSASQIWAELLLEMLKICSEYNQAMPSDRRIDFQASSDSYDFSLQSRRNSEYRMLVAMQVDRGEIEFSYYSHPNTVLSKYELKFPVIVEDTAWSLVRSASGKSKQQVFPEKLLKDFLEYV